MAGKFQCYVTLVTKLAEGSFDATWFRGNNPRAVHHPELTLDDFAKFHSLLRAFVWATIVRTVDRPSERSRHGTYLQELAVTRTLTARNR